ncbi:hypothetical protein DAPPUDRAFT_325786 [Daphnia pulex]|uniref:Uncharacterized protein n=1 Tax=Daphnia pulex TaxID=6669 RepID=E9H5K4_DAPPU|nr:hypothetical protein DAPPUDRAFT_325786 [Daphnia pulex]|eukprot:EFX72975.1 hypothetical protein DAPPUDRAFT_325786 [Daphnia pulex]
MKTESYLLALVIFTLLVLISSGHAEIKEKSPRQKPPTKFSNASNNVISNPRKGKPVKTKTTPVPKQGRNGNAERLIANYGEYAKILVETKMKMEWDKFLTSVLTILGFLSTLMMMTVDPAEDFPLLNAPSTGGIINHPDSFLLSLFQINQESYRAFLCAHNNINRIRLSTLTIPAYMKAALDILDTGDMELIESRLHLPLKVVQKSIENNVKWSSEVVAAFERLNQLIQEVHLAAVELQRVITVRKEQVAANKTIEELKNQDLQEYLSNRKKQVKEDLDKQRQTEQDLLEAYLSIPTDMDRISLDVAQFVTGLLAKMLGIFSNQEASEGLDNLIEYGNGTRPTMELDDPCIYNYTDQIFDISARSRQLFESYTTLSSLDSMKGKYDANDDMNHYQNLLTTNNASIECPPLQRIVEMGCKTIQQMHQLANVTNESMPILNVEQKMTMKMGGKAIFKEWREAQFVQVRKSIERFKENATRLANITSGRQAREVMENLTRRNLSESEQLTAFAHEKIAMYTEYAEVLKARLDNNTREITEKTSQFMSNLNQIRNWKTEEKDLKRAIEMLEVGLADMNEVKGNWAHLGHFFARFSQIIIETITSNSVGDFIQQLNTTIGTPSYKRNEGIKGIEMKKIRDKTVRVNKVLTVTNELATTYYNISRDYLMPRVHRLQFLMDVSTGNSSHLDSERGKLLNACEKDVIVIQQLISDEKRRLLEKVNATVRQIVESNYRFLQTNRTVERLTHNELN